MRPEKQRDMKMLSKHILRVGLGLILLIIFLSSFLSSLAYVRNVFAVPAGLSLRWAKPVGVQDGWVTTIGPLAADLNGDGRMEIVVTHGPSQPNGNAGSITALDALTGEPIWQDTSANMGFPLNLDIHTPFEIADLDRDGNPEIVVSTLSGPLALRSNGDLYWRRTDVHSGNHYLALCDINGDGHPEVFVGRGWGPVDGYDYLTCLSYDGQVISQGWSWSSCYGGLTVGDPSGDGKFMVFQGDRSYSFYGASPLSPDPYTGGGMGIHAYDAFTLKLLWSDPTVTCSSQTPILADVDKDGVLDVIVADQLVRGDHFGGIAVLNSADGSVVATGGKYRKGYTDMEAHSTPTVYDLDGDGNLELMDCSDSQPKIWDLYDWTPDGYLSLSDNTKLICHEPPKLGRVTADGKMDIIAMNMKDDSMYVFQYDPAMPGKYKEMTDYTVSGLPGASAFTLVQDLDGNAYNELVICRDGRVYCYNTPGPASSQKPRTGLQFYSERRCGAAEYIPPFTPSAPVLRDEDPQDGTVNQTYNPTLAIRATSFQNGTITGSFGSNSTGVWKTIGNFSGPTGLYSVSTSGMNVPGTTYYWNVTCNDATGTTAQLYSFTTASDPPTQETPRLDNDGSDNLKCYSQTTSDPNNDPVTNIYSWQVDGTSLDTLNLPFDTCTTSNQMAYDDILVNDFENGWRGWTTTTWDLNASQAHEGTYSAHATIGDTYLTSDEIDTSSAEGLTVSFWYRKSFSAGTISLQFYDGDIYRNILSGTGNNILDNVPSNTWLFYSLQTYDVRYSIRNFRVRFSASGIVAGDFWMDGFAITTPARTRDYSGNENHGTVHGAEWVSSGVVGGAYTFDGVNDFIRVADSPNLGGDGSWSQISLEFWIKPMVNQTGTRIIAKRDPTISDSSASYMVGFQSNGTPNTLYWGLGNTTSGWVETSSSQTVLTAGSWYHVVCTYKSGPGLTIYINGTVKATVPLADNIAQSQGVYLFQAPLFIGTDGSYKKTSWFNGILDEVHIYRKALSPEQIQERYYETRNGLSDSSSVVRQDTKIGGTWTCRITPNDSFGDGQSKLSNSVTTQGPGDIAILAIEPQTTPIPAGSTIPFNIMVTNHGGYSAIWNLTLSIDYVYVPVVRDLYLEADFAHGWNFTIPGPTISVVQGDLVNLTLQAMDGQYRYHTFFVDYNNDSQLNLGEPRSQTFAMEKIIFSFKAEIAGSFTYYDWSNQDSMFGLLIVNPPQQRTAQINSDSIELESNQTETSRVFWNTTDFPVGKYSVNAHAWPIPEERNTTDNSLMNPITVMVETLEHPIPSVSISPSSTVIEFGQSQLFSSTVSGGTMQYSYQWYLNGTLVSGATSGNWTFTPATTGQYTVHLEVVDGAGMHATSNSAIITVNVPVYTHDVAVIDVAPYKTLVGQNYTLNITVITTNLGDLAETLKVTAYANTTIIGTETVNDLPNGASIQLNFSWITTGADKGNYTLSAYVQPVEYETDTLDNNFTNPVMVMVGTAGDIVPAFGIIDMRDVSFVARRCFCPLEDPLWNPVADINADGTIDMKDLGIVAKAFAPA